jgi:hypothetical protein
MTVSYENATCRLCDQPIRKVKPLPQSIAIPSATPAPRVDPDKWKTDDDDALWFCLAGKGYHEPKR